MIGDTHDLICAVASAPSGALRGIIRLSGPTTVHVLATVFQPRDRAVDLASLRRPTAIEGDVQLTQLARRLPTTVLLWPTARSYTRQPMAELHTIGSPPLLEAVVAELLRHSARPAQPGEFTLRAFLGGRLDLTQAEAVAGLIDAESRRDLQSALAQLAGGLGGRIRQLRDVLLDLCAHLEAGLDFTEEDISFLEREQLAEQLESARAVLRELAGQLHTRTVQRPTYRVALVGSPNVGKSSLFNALVGRAAALVSARPGTTRDYLAAPLDCTGATVELVDTAGLDDDEQPGGDILRRAQESGWQQADAADVLLFCLDGARPLNRWEREQLARADRRRLIVWTKCDLHATGAAQPDAARTSALTGQGLDDLKARLSRALRITTGAEAEATVQENTTLDSTAARCGESLVAAGQAVDRALEVAQESGGDELVAAEVRLALEELGKVVGAVYTDDILDRVFSRFCIGK